MTDLKFGRRAPKRAPALMLSRLLTGVVPDHPTAADHLNIDGWQMLDNDQHGDCVAVTWANERRVMSRLAGAEHYPSLDDVITVYKTQNPNFPTDDGGMDIQTTLEYLVREGGPDGVKAVAFAKVDYTNADEVKAAVAIFGVIWVGVYVQAAQMDQFHAGQPWDFVPGSANDGGHSIVVGGYDSDNVGGDETFITWAQETSFTDSFWEHQVEEAWVVVWPEHLGTAQFTAGVDVQGLAEDFHALTGGTINIPPTPEPDPVPTPTPTAPVITSPTDGAELTSPTVSVTGSAAPGSVIVYNDEVAVATTTSTGSFSLTLTLAPGTHGLWVKDVNGASATVIVTVTTPVQDPDHAFATAAHEWTSHRHEGRNHEFALVVNDWLAARGL